MIPVSLNWDDKAYNLLELKDSTHNQLHKILDIQPHIYSKVIRRIKEKTNHKFVMTPDAVLMRWEVQKMYFDRINHLPVYVQKDHVKKMMEYMGHYYDLYEKMTNNKLDKPKFIQGNKEQFNELHQKTISAQKEIALVLTEMFKKSFSL